MTRRRGPEQTVNPLGPSAVVGLEGGRAAARHRQRRRQLKNQVISTAGAVVAVAVVAAAAYVGYTIYDEQQATARLESEQRQAELDRQGGADPSEVLDDLEESPVWNGPGNPNFGVGQRVDTTAPVTDADSGG